MAWTAAPALALRGAARLPVHRDGVPPAVLAIACVLSGLRLVPSVLLVRRTAPAQVAVVLVSLVFAATQLLHGRVGVTGPSAPAGVALAPPWATDVRSGS